MKKLLRVEKETKIKKGKETEILNYNIYTTTPKGEKLYITVDELADWVEHFTKVLEEFKEWSIQEQSSQKQK